MPTLHKRDAYFAMNECMDAAPPPAALAKTCNPPGIGTPVAIIHVSKSILPTLELLEGYNGIDKIKKIKIDHVTTDDYGLYNDSAGFCTVGFGSLVGRHSCTAEDIKNYDRDHPGGLTKAEAETQLRTDIQTKERENEGRARKNYRINPKSV